MAWRAFLVALSLALAVDPLAAAAQPGVKTARIGILRQGSPPDPFIEAFKQWLHELGYVEGRDLSIEYRWGEGNDERLPSLAADLVRLKVDVIVAAGSAVLPTKQATSAIPIVMPVATDPVGLGLVASLARPGGNVTGFAFLSEELPGKWMELLKEALPRITRVAVLRHPVNDPHLRLLRVSEVAARSLNVRLQVLNVGRPDDLGTAVAEARKHRAEALMVLPSSFFFAHRTRLAGFDEAGAGNGPLLVPRQSSTLRVSHERAAHRQRGQTRA